VNTKLHWYSQFLSTGQIFRQHGMVSFILYWLTGVLSLLSASFWARWLPDTLPLIGRTHDPETGKRYPALQDGVFLLSLVLTPLAIRLAWADIRTASAGCFLSAFLIFDSLSRHVRIMWFDDLEPNVPGVRRKVWSHRRILFLAILSYAQSIPLFSSLLHTAPLLRARPFQFLMDRSLGTATLLSLPDVITSLDILQIAVSLFYLAIVVATTASVAYKRGEAARDC